MTAITLGAVITELRNTPEEIGKLLQQINLPEHPISKMATSKQSQEFFLTLADTFENAGGIQNLGMELPKHVADRICDTAAELAALIAIVVYRAKQEAA